MVQEIMQVQHTNESLSAEHVTQTYLAFVDSQTPCEFERKLRPDQSTRGSTLKKVSECVQQEEKRKERIQIHDIRKI
jgi:hypothetical protein